MHNNLYYEFYNAKSFNTVTIENKTLIRSSYFNTKPPRSKCSLAPKAFINFRFLSSLNYMVECRGHKI